MLWKACLLGRRIYASGRLMSTAHWHWATHWAWNWLISSGSAGITIYIRQEKLLRAEMLMKGLINETHTEADYCFVCKCQHTSSVSNIVRLEENGELVLSLSSQWLSKKAAPRSLTRPKFTPARPAAWPWASPPRTRTDILYKHGNRKTLKHWMDLINKNDLM